MTWTKPDGKRAGCAGEGELAQWCNQEERDNNMVTERSWRPVGHGSGGYTDGAL